MHEEAVKSTGIRWIRYDERARTLDVAYVNSGEYRYFDVEPEVHAWLSQSRVEGQVRQSARQRKISVRAFECRTCAEQGRRPGAAASRLAAVGPG